MNKKIMLVLAAAFLLACNALFPQASRPTAESAVSQSTISAPQASTAQTAKSTGFTLVRLHPQGGELHTMLAREAQKAIALGQMPIAEFEATWCPPCQAIEEGLKSKNELMLKAYAGTYIIQLDVDEWGWTEEGVQDFKFGGIPVYFKLDAQGQQTGEVIDGDAWGDNIPENSAPPMDKFFHGK